MPAWLAAVVCAACSSSSPAGQRLATPDLEPGEAIVVQTAVHGLSGLTVDEDGYLWAVPEEDRVLLRLDLETGAASAFPIEGVPDGLDLESIAFLSTGRFVVGTESNGEGRRTDALITLRRRGDGFEIEQEQICPYSQWGVLPESNRGIEGLCNVNGEVVVATEVVREEAGRRFAPVARRSRFGWDSFVVELSSDTGKVSGLTCMAAPDGGVDVIAIERHFGHTRLLAFTLPQANSDLREVELQPRVIANLDDWVSHQSTPPNFEGITRLHDGRFAVVIDNFYHAEESGPSKLFVLHDALQPEAYATTLSRRASSR